MKFKKSPFWATTQRMIVSSQARRSTGCVGLIGVVEVSVDRVNASRSAAIARLLESEPAGIEARSGFTWVRGTYRRCYHVKQRGEARASRSCRPENPLYWKVLPGDAPGYVGLLLTTKLVVLDETRDGYAAFCRLK